MAVSRDVPALDIAYKLVEYGGRPRLKLSAGKILLPGPKQVYRVEHDGVADHDVLARRQDEPFGRPLLDHVMVGGRRSSEMPTLDGSRAHAQDELSRLPRRVRELEPAVPPYGVEISSGLTLESQVLRRQLERQGTYP
jgi:nicotinate phosphoribosyltransferase